jgi:signal transduction histidine kinase
MPATLRPGAAGVIGARAEFVLHPRVEIRRRGVRPAADENPARASYRLSVVMRLLYRWLTPSGIGGGGLSVGDGRAPFEAVVLRYFVAIDLVVFVLGTLTATPHPGLEGRGAVVVLVTIALIAAALATQPANGDTSVRRRIAALFAVSAAAAALAVLQPHGAWQAGAVFVGIVAALRLERRTGALTLACSLALLVAVLGIDGRGGEVMSVLFTAVPWFLVMRLMRELADQRNALRSSREAQARAAVAAERGRFAREMHDVLAHSLSALALQLESTRLLAADRGADAEVIRAIDHAHQLTASGLREARRAIATARGEELPGPDRIGSLADEFGQQSGLPVAVEVRGEPRELEPDARLAVYRTAQEALTNVRRHATAQRVEIELAYLPRSTVLVVEDRASDGRPPPAPLAIAGAGYGLTGMRERAELLGGQLLAEPTDEGFRVELRLPT